MNMHEYAVLKGQFLPPKALCYHFFVWVNYILVISSISNLKLKKLYLNPYGYKNKNI